MIKESNIWFHYFISHCWLFLYRSKILGLGFTNIPNSQTLLSHLLAAQHIHRENILTKLFKVLGLFMHNLVKLYRYRPKFISKGEILLFGLHTSKFSRHMISLVNYFLITLYNLRIKVFSRSEFFWSFKYCISCVFWR